MYSFPYLEPVCCSMSSANCCFLTWLQISQEAGQVVWYSHLFKNFTQFVVIHRVFCIWGKQSQPWLWFAFCVVQHPGEWHVLVVYTCSPSVVSADALFIQCNKIPDWDHQLMTFLKLLNPVKLFCSSYLVPLRLCSYWSLIFNSPVLSLSWYFFGFF